MPSCSKLARHVDLIVACSAINGQEIANRGQIDFHNISIGFVCRRIRVDEQTTLNRLIAALVADLYVVKRCTSIDRQVACHNTVTNIRVLYEHIVDTRAG